MIMGLVKGPTTIAWSSELYRLYVMSPTSISIYHDTTTFLGCTLLYLNKKDKNIRIIKWLNVNDFCSKLNHSKKNWVCERWSNIHKGVLYNKRDRVAYMQINVNLIMRRHKSHFSIIFIRWSAVHIAFDLCVSLSCMLLKYHPHTKSKQIPQIFSFWNWHIYSSNNKFSYYIKL